MLVAFNASTVVGKTESAIQVDGVALCVGHCSWDSSGEALNGQ